MVIVVAAWMLDPAACAAMAFGAPRVTLLALSELHQLLIERGFRRSSPDDPTIVQEEQDEEPMLAESSAIPRQLSIPFDSARLRGASPSAEVRNSHPLRSSAMPAAFMYACNASASA